MALLLPLLLTIVFGIIEFGFVFNAQVSLTQSVREGVRAGAIGNEMTPAGMIARMNEAHTAVRGGTPVPEVVEVCPPDVMEGRARLRARVDYVPMIGWFGEGIPLRATAVMRCGG
jgi:hypothetical protein